MTVYTGGTFDIPHMGHTNFFRHCKMYFPNDKLVVSLNTDEFIMEYKGRPPFFSYAERERLIKLSGYVDMVIKNIGGADSKRTILQVYPRIIIIGMDWLSKDYCKQMGFTPEWLQERGIALMYIPYTEGISTTEINKRLSAPFTTSDGGVGIPNIFSDGVQGNYAK